jgi:hypothetical protein
VYVEIVMRAAFVVAMAMVALAGLLGGCSVFGGKAAPEPEFKVVQTDGAFESGQKAAGPAEVAQYNPPWTIPTMRRNEILVPIWK